MTNEKYAELQCIVNAAFAISDSVKFQITSPAEDKLSDAVCALARAVGDIINELHSNAAVEPTAHGDE